MLRLFGTYHRAVRYARGNTGREVFTLAAPSMVFLLAAATLASVLG